MSDVYDDWEAEPTEEEAPKQVPFMERFWILLIGGLALGSILLMCVGIAIIFALRN